MVRRAGVVVAVAGSLLLGALGTWEVWQAATTGTIGLREGGIARASDPVMFWATFAVSAIIAAPLWITALFLLLLLTLKLLSRKAR